MKIGKMMMVGLILLAILTIGAVSASESAENLTVDDNEVLSIDESSGGNVTVDDNEVLSIDESSGDNVTVDDGESQSEVLSDGNPPGVSEQYVGIHIYEGASYSTTEEDEFSSVIDIDVAPYSNGDVVVSSGNKVFFNESLNNILNSYYYPEDNMGGCSLDNGDLQFFEGLSSGDIVKVSFLSESSQTFSNYFKVNFEGNSFRLEKTWDVWSWHEWDGPLYVDTDKDVVDINIQNSRINGTFYVTANGRQYKYVPHFDESGTAWHNWKLTSFDITEVGSYLFTIEYANDASSPREILYKDVLNVTQFNYDTFRVIVDTRNNINLYCPENQAGTVSIFLKDDWNADYPRLPALTYQITASDYNNWKTWNFEELGCKKEKEYIFKMKINEEDWELFNYGDEGFWYNDPWDVIITPAVTIEVWEDHFDNGDQDNNVFAVYIPEKSDVYNGTIEIKDGETTVFSKVLSTEMMEFDNDCRDYRYWVKYKDIKSNLINLKNNAVLTFSFKYNNTQVSKPFVLIKIINKKNYEIELEKGLNVDIFNEWWRKGPLYSDYNGGVVNFDIHSSAVNGIFYVAANGIEYKYEPFFDEEGNAWHNWILGSFNITGAGSYPVTIEYAKNDTSQRTIIFEGVLNVVEFNHDAFRVVESNPNQLISIYCPEGSNGSVISIYMKDDWDKDYPAKPIKTINIVPELYNQWINLTYGDLGLRIDSENIILIETLRDGAEMMNPYETSIWYNDEPYDVFIPDGISLLIRQDDFRSENPDDTVVELYVPESTFVSSGTLNITSKGNNVYSKVLSLKNMDFNHEGRYYIFNVPFGDLNLKNLKSGDIVTFAFTNDVKNISRSLLYKIENKGDEENPDECVNFNLVNFVDANFLRDEIVIEIIEFPDGVDDEFAVFIDRWGEYVVNTTWKISELARNPDGLYTFNCSALKYELVMTGMADADFDVKVQFYMSGNESYSFWGNPWVYKNPNLHSGEIALGDEDAPVISFFEIPEYYDDEFIVKVTNDGVTTPLVFKLSELAKLVHDDEGYWLILKDLNISEKGIYDICIEFTENGEKVRYNSTISVVDFVIYPRPNVEQINDAAFRIMLPENSTGRVVILVNDTEVFNNTLSYIGYRYWNRMGGYNIPLNYLQINESGNYSVELQVYDDNGKLLRTVTNNFDIIVGENEIRFADLVYAYGESDFLYLSSITHPLPIDGVLVLYLNNKESGSYKIVCDEFKFKDLDPSFVDEFGNLKPGFYNAVIKLIDGDKVSTLVEDSFKIWDINGTTCSVPANALIVDDVYVSFSAPALEDYLIDYARLQILIDPYSVDEEMRSDNVIEIFGRDLEGFLDGATHKIKIGRLSVGSHNLLVQYVVDYFDDYDRYMDYEFISHLYKITVKKITTKITVKTLKTTYNSGKYLTATLKDQRGKLIKNTWVTVKISGGANKKAITKKIKSNSKGQIRYLASALKVSNKYYTVKFTFAASSSYYGSSASAKVKISKASPVLKPKVKKYKAKTKTKKYTVTVTTAKKPLKKVKVTLKVKGKTFNAKTNGKGVATFKVTKLTKKGTYKATAVLKGTANYKKASKSFKIVVK